MHSVHRSWLAPTRSSSFLVEPTDVAVLLKEPQCRRRGTHGGEGPATGCDEFVGLEAGDLRPAGPVEHQLSLLAVSLGFHEVEGRQCVGGVVLADRDGALDRGRLDRFAPPACGAVGEVEEAGDAGNGADVLACPVVDVG